MGYDVIIGIDCGISNGSISHYYNKKYTSVRMPKNSIDLSDYLKHLASIGNALVIIEKVHLRKPDIHGGKIFNMQKLIKNFNDIELILKLNKIPFVEVYPSTWESIFVPMNSREEKNENYYKLKKKKLKNVCEAYLGKYIKITLWNCDSLLLVIFGLRKLQFEPQWVNTNLFTNQNKLL